MSPTPTLHPSPSLYLAPTFPRPLLHSAYCVLIAVWYCFAVYAKPLDGPQTVQAGECSLSNSVRASLSLSSSLSIYSVCLFLPLISLSVSHSLIIQLSPPEVSAFAFSPSFPHSRFLFCSLSLSLSHPLDPPYLLLHHCCLMPACMKAADWSHRWTEKLRFRAEPISN